MRSLWKGIVQGVQQVGDMGQWSGRPKCPLFLPDMQKWSCRQSVGSLQYHIRYISGRGSRSASHGEEEKQEICAEEKRKDWQAWILQPYIIRKPTRGHFCVKRTGWATICFRGRTWHALPANQAWHEHSSRKTKQIMWTLFTGRSGRNRLTWKAPLGERHLEPRESRARRNKYCTEIRETYRPLRQQF